MFHLVTFHAMSVAVALLLTVSVCSAQPPQDQPPQPAPQQEDDQPPPQTPPDPDQPQDPAQDDEHPEQLRPLETPETLEPVRGEPLPPRPAGIGRSERPSSVRMPDRRPYRSLFGGAGRRDANAQTLDLTLSAFGGWDQPYDRPVVPEQPDTRANLDGRYAGTAGTLSYNRPGRRLDLSGYGSGFVGYFPNREDDPWYPSTSAGVAGTWRRPLGDRTDLRLTQVEHWSSDLALGYLGGLSSGGTGFPPASGDTAFDYSLQRSPSLASATEAGVDHRLSNKSTLTGFLSYRNVYFFEDGDDLPRRDDYRAGLSYRRRLSRYMSLRAGYAYRTSRLGFEVDEEPRAFHDIDLGVDYARSLPLSRRTLLSFSTGSTITARDSSEEDDVTALSRTRFFVIGSAALSHEIGRSWITQLSYSRDVRYEDGFSDPFLRDSATASIGGMVSRRVDVVAWARWSSAAIGLEERNFSTVVASAQARTAITQNLAVYANYYYYLQDFDAGVALPPGVVRDLSRQGARIGLTTWLPLWSSR